MLPSLVTVVLAALTTTTHVDTTFEVRQGARFSVTNFAGDILVSAWGRNAVRVQADRPDRARVLVAETGPNLDVRTVSRRGEPVRVDYAIIVPEWMPLILQGVYSDIMVKGSKSDISAETTRGEVSIDGGEGYVRASSVEGSVAVAHARGRVEVSSVNEDVSVSNCKGEIAASAINGDIRLEDIESSMVEASTVSGDVMFFGGVSDRGRYRLSTHDGDLMLGVPERANATVSVSTFSGDFESAFPVQFDRSRPGRRFNFTLGSGSALVNLESFGGTIQLRRPMELRALVKLKDAEKLERRERAREIEALRDAGRVRVIRRR